MLAVPLSRNLLLGSLSASDLGLLKPYLKSGDLPLWHDMEAPNKRVEAVYFPEAGFASVVAGERKKAQVEIGLIGSEGMTGLTILLGNNRSPNSTYIQAAGSGQRMKSAELRKAMNQSRSLHRSLLKYAQVFMLQTAHTAIANARAKLDERLARWILMAHDRLQGTTLPLTHEFLSLMLGVRRAGVTIAIQELEAEKLIEAARGAIIVIDRKGIERKAGGYYGVPEAEYRRLIG